MNEANKPEPLGEAKIPNTIQTITAEIIDTLERLQSASHNEM
jgi:hypothetical protein